MNTRQALVLFGPQGCGKSQHARELAAREGTFVECVSEDLTDPFRLGTALSALPATLIVDGLPATAAQHQVVKQILCCETAEVNQRGRPVRQVRSPNFIFCTSDPDAVRLLAGDRRYRVLSLP